MPDDRRTSAYKPALAWFAALGTAWVFVLVTLGAFTTSIGAGMAFLDWPLSNGSLNPRGWLSEPDKFAEHSHRLSASLMSTITIILAVWLWRTEARRWLRRLAWFAVGLVLAQAVVGGLRVLFDRMQIEMVDTSLGRLFAMLHACLAQLFICTLIALATACSKPWITGRPRGDTTALRRTGLVCCALLFVQLAIAAVMRHSFAGLAIPYFPFANAEGGLLPDAWNFRVGIHFAHRVMAAVIAIGLVWFAGRLWTSRAASLAMRCGASLLVSLLALQIILGAQIILTMRNPIMTTGHVLVGALTLATTFWITWLAHRDVIEGRTAA
ncbi:MAG TPA: COX15/CtaA family protein [Opitutaceae bacterium]|nr:COX15/CtaA family protein [Opitutaceae bacterium]